MEDQLENISKKIFSILGPGYSERVYHNAFEVELRLQGLSYETEKILPVTYQGHTIGNLRADLVVAGQIIVELKSIGRLKDEFRTQARNYMKLTGLRSALLVNFPLTGNVIELERLTTDPPLEAPFL
jgi:GxxExxY protein